MKQPQEVGGELKQARLAMGWTLEQAAHETKLRQDILSKIEENQYDLFPSHAYARGFVRIYARKLGLDDALLLRQLEGTLGEDEIPVGELRPEALESLSTAKKKNTPQVSAQMIGLGLIALIVLIALTLGVIKLYRIWPALSGKPSRPVEQPQPATTIPVVPTPTPNPPTNAPGTTDVIVKRAETVEKTEEVRRAETIQPTPPAPVEPPQATLNRLRLKCEDDCWVRVTGVIDGKETLLFEGMMEEGTTLPAADQEAWKAQVFLITLEDASVVDIVYNNENFGKYDEAEGRASFRIPPQ